MPAPIHTHTYVYFREVLRTIRTKEKQWWPRLQPLKLHKSCSWNSIVWQWSPRKESRCLYSSNEDEAKVWRSLSMSWGVTNVRDIFLPRWLETFARDLLPETRQRRDIPRISPSHQDKDKVFKGRLDSTHCTDGSLTYLLESERAPAVCHSSTPPLMFCSRSLRRVLN